MEEKKTESEREIRTQSRRMGERIELEMTKSMGMSGTLRRVLIGSQGKNPPNLIACKSENGDGAAIVKKASGPCDS